MTFLASIRGDGGARTDADMGTRARMVMGMANPRKPMGHAGTAGGAGGALGVGRLDRLGNIASRQFPRSCLLSPVEPAFEEPVREAGARKRREYLLMGISVSVAALGCLCWLLYHRPPQLAAANCRQLGGLYKAVAEQVLRDELYSMPVRESADRWLNDDSMARNRPGSHRRDR